MNRKHYLKDRKCCICNKDLSIGNNHGVRYYDKKGNWDGKSYMCNKCYNINKYPNMTIDYKIQHIDNRRKLKFKGRKCSICNKDLSIGEDHGCRNHDEKGNWTGEYLCNMCDLDIRNNLPDSYKNLIKTMRKCRTGELSINDTLGKVIIYQAVISKVLKIEDLNIKMDNFKYYIDMEHNAYGKIDCKGVKIDKFGIWNFESRRKIDCDTYICLGFDQSWSYIDAVYIIPNTEEIINIRTISIAKNPLKLPKYDYEEFRIDEKPYNDAFQSIMLFLKDKKYFGIEYIKEWLKVE